MPIENRLADEDLVSPVPGLAEAVRQRLAKLESESVDRQWRVLASVLYSALGAPDVEGITAIRVTRLLNGKIANAQEIDDLMHAMLRQVSALHAKHTAPRSPARPAGNSSACCPPHSRPTRPSFSSTPRTSCSTRTGPGSAEPSAAREEPVPPRRRARSAGAGRRRTTPRRRPTRRRSRRSWAR